MKAYLSVAILALVSAVVAGRTVRGGKDVTKVCRTAKSQGKGWVTVADPDSCENYYGCSDWFSAKLACAAGQHYNAEQQLCMDPCEAGCDPDVVCTTTAAPTTTSAPSTTEVPTTTSETVSEAAPSVDAEEDSAAADVVDDVVKVTENGDQSEVEAGDEEDGEEQAESEVESEVAEASTVRAEAEETQEEEEDSAEELGQESEVTTETDVETTTAFWQGIMAHFNKPPATIPGYDGTIPPNY